MAQKTGPHHIEAHFTDRELAEGARLLAEALTIVPLPSAHPGDTQGTAGVGHDRFEQAAELPSPATKATATE